MMRKQDFYRLSFGLCIPLLAIGLSGAAAANTGQVARGDFNGDGRDDMLVGIPSEDVGSIKDAGAVSLYHGTSSGLFHLPVHQLHQNTPATRTRAGIEGIAETGDRFGAVLAVGDFDNDGYDDAIIGVPNENNDSGAVHIQYGSNRGAYGPRNALLTLDRMQHFGYNGARFGAALAAGDIDGDGYDDLAVGIPHLRDTNPNTGENVEEAGAVIVIYGSDTGLIESPAGSELILQSYPNQFVPIFPHAGNHFGAALTMDDFDRNGYQDLAIGIPGRSVGRAGSVLILHGGENGILYNNETIVHDFNREESDAFGSRLASGDFDGNGYPDLAVGIPEEDNLKGRYNVGAVAVFFSDSSGIKFFDVQSLTQADIDEEESYDSFGFSLVATDFNRDGYDDLAVGSPFETRERFLRPDHFAVGQVSLFLGGASGLRSISSSNWHQDTGGVAGKRRENNLFGYSLAAGDYNNDRYPDLIVTVPGEDVVLDNGSKQKDAGTLHILYGHSGGLSSLRHLGREVYTEPNITSGNAAARAERKDGFGGFPRELCAPLCSPY